METTFPARVTRVDYDIEKSEWALRASSDGLPHEQRVSIHWTLKEESVGWIADNVPGAGTIVEITVNSGPWPVQSANDNRPIRD